MRTPAGFECRYFFGNYFRGRHVEECRLIGNIPSPRHWSPDLCKKCPVPGILRANSCPNMELEAKVERSFFGIFRNIKVIAYCIKSKQTVTIPEVGCGECHPLPAVFLEDR